MAALRMQGESIDEITAFAEVMREKGVKIRPQREVMDIVGTGGDEAGTFNISTTAAFVVAAGGFRWQSTETAVCPAKVGQQMYWNIWGPMFPWTQSRMKRC